MTKIKDMSNPELSEDALRLAARSNRYRGVVGKNPNTPVDVLTKMSYKSPDVVLQNPVIELLLLSDPHEHRILLRNVFSHELKKLVDSMNNRQKIVFFWRRLVETSFFNFDTFEEHAKTVVKYFGSISENSTEPVRSLINVVGAHVIGFLREKSRKRDQSGNKARQRYMFLISMDNLGSCQGAKFDSEPFLSIFVSQFDPLDKILSIKKDALDILKMSDKDITKYVNTI